MSNMSYCRFRNTLHDLNDCFGHLESGGHVESPEEARARERLFETCEGIVELIKHDSDLREEILGRILRDEDGNRVDADGNRLDEDGKIIPESDDEDDK